TTFQQRAIDRAEWKAVMRVVVDAQRRAILEDHAPRALQLDRKYVEWILEPTDLEPLTIERARLDRAAVVVRHGLVPFIEATDLTVVWKSNGAEFLAGGDEIRRAAIEREMKYARGESRALNDRFEITCQQTLGFAQSRDAHR